MSATGNTPTAPPARSLRVTGSGLGWTLVSITDRGTTDSYIVTPESSPVGVAYRWTDTVRAGSDYVTEMGGEHAGPHCSCPAGMYWRSGKRPCRHLAASRALLARGVLSCG